MAKSPSGAMRKRMLWVAALIILVGFMTVTVRLFQLQIVDGEFYKSKAQSQQMSQTTITAARGTIYDANMTVLAQSATAWTIVLAPAQIKEKDWQLISSGLAPILGVEESRILEACQKTASYYEIIKRKVDRTVAEQVIAFASDNDIDGINLIEDSKRYYPFDNFASTVLGFTGTDNKGLAGIEAYYDSYLQGTAGTVLSARNAWGIDMPDEYETMVSAQDGNSLVLTIDQAIQHYLEKQLDIAVEEHNVQDRAAGIVMNVKTGEILAMATKPDFNLNEPFVIADEETKAAIDALTGDARSEKLGEAQNYQWRNKIISDIYEPGSVFKIVTFSSALEEGVASFNDTFFCKGYEEVAGVTMHCWKTGGHGAETFVQGVGNSCNPVFIELGRRLGVDKFTKYLSAYGFTSKTGIDLPGEEKGIVMNAGQMGPVELASCSFGQSNKITPIQMMTAACAAINGGYLVQPHLVKQILDADGNVVKSYGTEVKRQVISNETSKKVCEVLESVVTDGGGKNAYIPGYRVGGKSGTAEKLDSDDPNARIASFFAMAPADDPEIAVLILLDNSKSYSQYGSVLAAPAAAAVLADALPYLGIEPQYSEEELADLDVTVPNVTNSELLEAQNTLRQNNLNSEVVGNGTTVLRQVPEYGSSVPNGGSVILYTEEGENEMATVPDVVNLSGDQVNARLTNAGLQLRVTGAGAEGSTTSISQSVAAGEQVPRGTVITVEFRDKEGSAD